MLLAFGLLALWGGSAQGQRQRLVDSLTTALKGELPDTTRALLLFELGYELRRSLPDSSQHCAERALALSVLNGYDRGPALAHRLLGIQAYFKGDYPRALELHQKALLIFESIGDVRGRAAVTYHIGAIFQRLGFFEQAIAYYERALPVFEQYAMRTEYASALNNIGETLLQQKAYEGARVNFRQSMALFEQLGEQQFVAENLRNLGEVALALGELEVAERELLSAQRIFAQLGHELGTITTRLNLAELAMARGQAEVAVFEAGAALRLSQTRGLRDRALVAHQVLARAQAKRGLWQEAYGHQERFKALSDSVQGAESAKRIALMESEGILNVERTKIALLVQQKQLDRTIHWGLGAVIVLVLLLAVLSVRSYQRQKRANRLLEERADEIEHQRAVLAQSAMELREANDRVTAESAARERANHELRAALDHLRDTQQQLIVSEKMASLGRLVSNIAHELNTPLGVILSSGGLVRLRLPELLSRLTSTLASLQPEWRAWFDGLLQQAATAPLHSLSARQERQLRQRLTQAAEQAGWPEIGAAAEAMIRLGITELEQLPPTPAGASLNEASTLLSAAAEAAELLGSVDLIGRSADKTRRIVSALRLFAHDADHDYGPGVAVGATIERAVQTYAPYLRPGVTLEVQLSDDGSVVGHPDELSLVWGNLLLNAIQAVGAEGQIRIESQREGHTLRVSIRDTGSGVAAEHLPRMFEPFFTTRARGEGSGLGLYVSKKIVENHGGRIALLSGPGATTVTVELPLEANTTPQAAPTPSAERSAATPR